MSFRITNADLVLADEVVRGADLVVADEMIAELGSAPSGRLPQIDLGGALLFPGLIDLHSDAIEKWIEPRPNVRISTSLALWQADMVNASSGITTPFHSISFAAGELGLRSAACAERLIHSLHNWKAFARVDHHCHCRYEITDIESFEVVLRTIARGQAHLVSLMDHTPGQGQFKSAEAYQWFLMETNRQTPEAAAACVARKLNNSAAAGERFDQILRAARARDVAVAVHDADQPLVLAEWRRSGISICEFPINLETAVEAKKRQMVTVFGAPNVLRGCSQSGSIRALDAILAGAADCLCSDYLPAALLQAVFWLSLHSDLTLAEAARMATIAPAAAAGLGDRGAIQVGKRADLVAAKPVGEILAVTRVWANGRSVLQADFP